MATFYVYEEDLESQDVSITADGPVVTRTYQVKWSVDGATNINPGVNVNPENAAAQFLVDVAVMGSSHPLFANPFIYLEEVRGEVWGERFAKVFATWRPAATEFTANSHGEVWRWSLGTQETLITSVPAAARQSHYPTGDVHDAGMAIGVDDQGNVNGAMVARPSITATVEKKIPNANFDVQSGIVLARLNTVNSDYFWTYKPGEVLFRGAEQAKTAEDEWTFIYTFEAARKQEAITWEFAPDVANPSGSSEIVPIEPWQVVWMRFAKPTGKTSNDERFTRNTIKDLHVATVYETSVFGAFNLNSPSS